MFKVPLPELKAKILASGKLMSAQLDQRIKEKINELSGLVSEEGAAHILANELGIEIIVQGGKLKVKELYPGMRNISLVGKVVRKYELREFQKEGRTGKVCSLMVGDDTGMIRAVFWNDQVELLQQVKEDDIVLLKDCTIRENATGKEIHLGERSHLIINPPGEQVNLTRQSSGFVRKRIQELTGQEEGAEILGTIIQVFDPRFFYVCPRCSRKALESEGQFRCQEHGVVEGQLSYVLNAVLDDGSGNIRSVFWKQQTNHLLGKTEQEMQQFRENIAAFESIKTDLLGEQFKVMGRVKKNEMFDRLEFSAQLVEKADPQEELARLEQQQREGALLQ